MNCPACGRDLPGEFPFCPYCAAPLGDRRAPTSHEERKVVSVLFCDLVGFTQASERADPEDVRARLRPYHERVRTELERFGGTVEKFVGDAVMAVFGAPVAHEDDPERAVRAGLRIIEAIAELNAVEAALQLKVRIGINTGEAVVSLDARPEQGEGMVAGDVVNTAARIQSAAPIDGVAVSEETYRQTSRIFVYEELPPAAVKGKTEPVPLHRALEPRARFGSDVIRTHTTPFVGRDVERTLLQGLFERSARDQAVQLVTLVGEPGVGKSRLCAELFRFVDDRPDLVTWRQGRCLPYGDGISLWALGEIVKAEAGIFDSDAPEVAAAKLDGVLPQVEELPWLKARLLPLLGIDSGEPASREELFTAWRRFLETLAAEGPAVIVVEDLHWADPVLVEFLAYFAEWAEGVPLLLLCTARPELYERHPTSAAGLRNATTITLSPLSELETADLVKTLLVRGVSEPVERAILERAGGNPLYAEEFVRLLAERGLEEPGEEVAFPDTVQALIAARLDILSPERKSLLQDAAVLGKVFWAGALAEMGGLSENEVELALHELSRRELVRPARTSSMQGESEYAFWHVLVRDVAYGQIPRRERVRRHRAAAGWIEAKAGDRVDDLADLLAHHYTQALEIARAAGRPEEADELAAAARRFLRLAGERAVGLDTARAGTRFEQALALMRDDDPGRPELVLRSAEVALHAGRPREAAEALEAVLPELRDRADREQTAFALRLLASVSGRQGDHRRARALALEAVALLETAAPGEALVEAYAGLAGARVVEGAPVDAVATAERALVLAEQLGLPVPASALGVRGTARASLGEQDGVAEAERALALLVERGEGHKAAVLMNNLALARWPLEGPAATLAACDRAIAFCEPRGLASAALHLEGTRLELLAAVGKSEEARTLARRLTTEAEQRAHVDDLLPVRTVELAVDAAQGRVEAALARADWLLEHARATGSLEFIVMVYAPLAAALVGGGRPEEARALLGELAEDPAARNVLNYPWQLAALVRTALAAGDAALAARLAHGFEPAYPEGEHALCAARAALAEAAGRHEEAATLYGEAAERWREFGTVPEQAQALLGEGRCLLTLGRDGAEEPLRRARELFAEMGYAPAVAETERLLENAAIGNVGSAGGRGV